ncbi:MAG: hypothetical protein QXF15_00635 [Candidatus Aenigmatarchaeota archaeon]
MQTVCDICGESVKSVGRLVKVRFDGATQHICSSCRRKIRMRFR